jgi:DNA-binding NarL/FixJ family response regulator
MPRPTGVEVLIRASTEMSGLTDRQRDVLRGLSMGLTNRQIAADLGISESTVKVHVGNALEALGLESRLQLGIAAYIHLAGCSCGHGPVTPIGRV